MSTIDRLMTALHRGTPPDQVHAMLSAAIADARRDGAEQMREMCAKATEATHTFPVTNGDLAVEIEALMYPLGMGAQDIRSLPLPTGPRQPEPSDPLDMPLPCDIKIGHGTHGKGTTLRGLVTRMRLLYDMVQKQASQSLETTTGPRQTVRLTDEQIVEMSRKPAKCEHVNGMRLMDSPLQFARAIETASFAANGLEEKR